MSDNQALDTFDGLNYEEIEKAVMETSRGRWFLTEFARRHKAADTAVLLDAIKRLESQIQTMSAETASSAVAQQLEGLEGLAELEEQPEETQDDSAGVPEMSGKLDRTAKLVRSLRSSHKLISKAAEKPLRQPLPLSNAKPRPATQDEPPGFVDSDEDIFADEQTVSAQGELAAGDGEPSTGLEAAMPVDGDTLNFADIDMPDTSAVTTDSDDAENPGAGGATDSDDEDEAAEATASRAPANQVGETQPEPTGEEQAPATASDSADTGEKSKKRIIVIRRPADDPGEIPLAGVGEDHTGSDTPAA